MLIDNLSKVAHRLFGNSKASNKSQKSPKKDHAQQTRISQSLQQVLKQINEDQIQKVLIVGSKSFRDEIAAASPHLSLSWASTNIDDILSGAENPHAIDLVSFQAVVCGGPEVASNYRVALTKMYSVDQSRPVYWVANDWEFCGGTFPVPAEIDDVEVMLFNHFQHFFGLKDHLLFHIQVICGKEEKRFTRILAPLQSMTLRLSDYFPNRREAAAFAALVHYPNLTRGRHYRLRMVGDVFWQGSLTTLHGVHEFNRSPSHKFKFRAAVPDLRNGDVILTLPNYARDLADPNVLISMDAETKTYVRKHENLIDQVYVKAADTVGKSYIGWNYEGYGGSNWYILAPKLGPNGKGALAANHHASVPVVQPSVTPMEPAEREQIKRLRDVGYVLDPYLLPVTRADEILSFGFNCASASPPVSDYILHTFDVDGQLLGQHLYKKLDSEAIFTEDLPHVSDNPRVALVSITPDFERIGIRRKELKLQFDLVVRHRSTGDWDMTEGQTSWRNVGIAVPGTAHFAGPMGAVIGRTNLTARARSGRGFNTAVVAVHGSGRINYKQKAKLKIAVYALDGSSREAEVSVPSFTARLIWLNELWPDLASFLGPNGIGPLLVTSQDADINCNIVTTSTDGAISLQHMWGY